MWSLIGPSFTAGPRHFLFHGHTFVREDLQIQNPRGLQLECSWWKPRSLLGDAPPCVATRQELSTCIDDPSPLRSASMATPRADWKPCSMCAWPGSPVRRHPNLASTCCRGGDLTLEPMPKPFSSRYSTAMKAKHPFGMLKSRGRAGSAAWDYPLRVRLWRLRPFRRPEIAFP